VRSVPGPSAVVSRPTHRRAAPGVRQVVIDTDMAPDDWMAILYLLMHPQVEVQAVTVTGAGEAHCRPGVRHALDLVALAGQPHVPVTCGRATPLRGDREFPRAWRARVDNLFGLQLPRSVKEPSAVSAVELLGQIIRSDPGRVEIIALGPLTNLGELLLREPALPGQIAFVTIMGGAVRVPGNVGRGGGVGDGPAEWNLHVDPYATRLVLGLGRAVLLIPLDATNHVPMTTTFLERIAADHSTPAADFVYQTLEARRTDVEAGRLYFWDPLAAVALTNPEVVTIEELPLLVRQEDGPAAGQTYIDPAGSPVRVALGARQAAFEGLFLDTLNGR
jgi:pyrimidine-specific ribonucleoside hydrolase